jgi:HEAT repeat protein
LAEAIELVEAAIGALARLQPEDGGDASPTTTPEIVVPLAQDVGSDRTSKDHDSAELPLQAPTARLVAAPEDRNSMVRFNAMSALSERLTPALLPVIERLLNNPDDYIRQMATDYYGQLS